MAKRELICMDALKWLQQQPEKSVSNVITGICDLDEMSGLDVPKYLEFFKSVGDQVFKKLKPDGYAIFIQTDRKYQKNWIDKSYILNHLARMNGFKLVWHKIVLHRDVNSTDLHRPTYAHMLCYTVTGTSGAATPDVIPVSSKTYKNATPKLAAERAVEFISKYSPYSEIVDPFVGQGTIVVAANDRGLNAVGIDIDPNQIEITKNKK